MSAKKTTSSKTTSEKDSFSKKKDEAVIINEKDNNYEVNPVFEFDDKGKVLGIKPSRELTDEEKRSVQRKQEEKYSHIHPDIVQVTEKHFQKIKKAEEHHVFRKRIVYLSIWIYILVSILFVNPDAFLARKILNIPILLYSSIRFFTITIIVWAIWKRVGNKRMWKTICSFMAFPIFPGIWWFLKSIAYHIPKNFIKRKNYYLLYVYVDFIITFFVKFKTVIFSASVFLLGIILSVFTENVYSLFAAIILLGISQLLHLKRRWNELFGPLKIFQIKIQSIKDENQPLTVESIDKQIRKVIQDDKKKLPKNKTNRKTKLMKEIEQYVLYNEVFKALNSNLKDVLASQSYLKHLVVKSFYSLLFAVVIFGGINYSLYKIDTNHFQVSGDPSLFNFMYYSFFTIFSEGVSIEPLSDIGKVVRMTGVLIGAVINFLILAVYFTVVNEKYKENLKGLTLWTSSFSKEMNEHMQTKYKRDGEENKSWLSSQGSGLAKHIDSLQYFFKTGEMLDKK